MLPTTFFSVAVAQGEGVAIAAPTGEVDVLTAPELTARLRGLFETGARDVIVDLSEVVFLDIPSARMLAESAEEAALSGARLYLMNAAGQPRDLIERTGLTAAVGLVVR